MAWDDTKSDGDLLPATEWNAHVTNQKAIPESQISLSDNTTNDVSATKHGFCPKTPNDSGKVLFGNATWGVEPVDRANGITPTTSGTWATAPAPLGDLTDNDYVDFTTVGRVTYPNTGDINIDLGTTYRLRRIEALIKYRIVTTNGIGKIEIDVSNDNVTWSELISHSTSSGDTGTLTRVWNAIPGNVATTRYIRIRLSHSGSSGTNDVYINGQEIRAHCD